MNHSDGSAPVWLFSFVDLAFLMVIAMTQLAPDSGAKIPDLGEMIVPRIHASAVTEMGAGAAEVWQLRVHPPQVESTDPPFELVKIEDGVTQENSERIDAPELRIALATLKEERGRKPMLAPHEDSRSQDMLEAAALIEESWPGRRRATISRVFDRG